MRSSVGRTDKYRKKLRALVLPGQTARYAPTAQDRLHLEYCVKREAITPMLQFSYVAFCEELIKHEASKRPEEATGIYNKWLNRGLDATTLQSVASCIGVSIEIPAPPVCDWSWKRKLTFSGNVSGTNLDDFPILVHLTNANFDFNKAKNLGEDIRFMDSDTCPADGTPLKHEIELWDKPGANAWVWVKVPRIDGSSNTDFIYMFYGNAAAADGQDVNNTWNPAYDPVWHFKGNGTATLPDSTVNAHHGIKKAIGEPANFAAGKANGCQHFDGANDYVTHPTLLDTFPSNGTISFWFNPDWTIDTGLPNWIRMVEKVSSLTPRYILVIEFEHPTQPDAGTLLFMLKEIGGFGTHEINTTTNSWSGGVWHHIVVTWGAGGMEIWVDGVREAFNAGWTQVPAPGTARDLRVSTNRDGDYPFDGKIDEFRISHVQRSGDWILAQHKTQDETLITYGAEEPG